MFFLIGFSLLFMFALAFLISEIIEIHLVKTFKEGIKLNGEIVQVFFTPNNHETCIRPRVSVLLDGEEHIFQAFVLYTNYKLNDQVDVFYNKKKYPKHVYIYKRKENLLHFITLIILILCLFYVIIGSMHRLLTAKYCISNSLNEIFIYFIIFLLSLYPSYILAKKHIKNTHFSDANNFVSHNLSASNIVIDKCLDISNRLQSKKFDNSYDINVIREAVDTLNSIKNNDRYLPFYLKLTIDVLDSYIALKDFDSAFKLIYSIEIYKVVKSRLGIYNWLEVVQLLDRKMKILKEVGDKNRIEELVLEGKPLMKRAEKFFKDNKPGTIIDVEIKRFYYECCLFEKDYEGAKEQARAMFDIAYYIQSNLILADLLLAEVSMIQGDIEEFKMRMKKAESIARNDYDKSENKMWFEEYKKKLNY